MRAAIGPVALRRHRFYVLLLSLMLAGLAGCATRAGTPTIANRTPSDASTPALANRPQAAVAAQEVSRSDASASARSQNIAGGAPFAIVTGVDRETDFQIGRDLAQFVAPSAGLRMDVLASKGSTENMHRLHDDPNVDLAIVQYDVFQAFLDEAAKGNAAAARIVRPMRVVMPLYTEEIYFIVRRDSPMNSIDQIKGKKINLGAVGSGSALSVAALYQRMFRTPIAPSNASYLSDQRALAALTVDKTIDVVVVIAGQPARLLADMKSAAREYIKLLRIDPDQAASRAAFTAYFPAVIRATNYANWLERDVPTLSVMSFLVTTGNKGPKVDAHLAALAQSICRNIGVLQKQGHPKWREVEVGRKLGNGWAYSPLTETELARCPAAQTIAGVEESK